ncbi:MAG: malonyl-CoA decarboxylase [Pseudomonadota bacterium]
MSFLADLLSTVFERRYLGFSVDQDDDRPIETLTEELIGATGEVSGQTVARRILDRYERMDDEARLDFFRHLALEMTISPNAVRQALDAYEKGQTKASYRAFMSVVEPPRQELIRRLNQVPGATGALVRMRADLLRLGGEDDALQALDMDFRHLLASWFNRGFLVLRPINWESPAHILEKIIAYEAVHAIGSWDDLRRRLQPADRRCFAFFHPAMPDEPLIFVEIALTQGVPGSVQDLLAEDREALPSEDANTAVFYSISNCQKGLASISFGNSLIKQVAADLKVAMPGLKTFVTLSPIPGLVSWLEAEEHDYDPGDDEQIKRLAAYYLLMAKHQAGGPLDPVARFHLGNGAMVRQIHAKADISERGLTQSAGAMVNYLYDLSKVAQNHERFAAAREIAASSDVRSLSASVEKSMARS